MTKRERRWWNRKKGDKLWPEFIHISTPGTCDECGKQTDGLMTCYYLDDTTVRLCPTCLEEDGSFCLCCGQFCAGLHSFDFIHPGYCNNCWDEIESNDWDSDEDYDPLWGGHGEPVYDPDGQEPASENNL